MVPPGGTNALEPLGTLAASGIVTVTGLNLPPKLSRVQWEELGAYIGALHNVTRFAIGDWLNDGERRWGEIYAQGMESTGLAYETLTNYANVCRSIPPPRRRAELSFSHHAEVAKLEPDEQDRWLTRAVEEGLSRRALREAIHPPEATALGGVQITVSGRYRCPNCRHEW